jgi:thioredoxin 1
VCDLILHVSDSDFDEVVLKATKPVLVDYWAEWCGPCKMIAPILETVAEEFRGSLIVAKLDIDKNTDMPSRYSVRGIPTLMIFKEGDVHATKVGALSKKQLVAFINENI